jgi:hypothetical protein
MKHSFYYIFLFCLFAAANLGMQLKVNFREVKINEVDKYFSFARKYGYIKYFYPGDETAAIDWDKFAYYGASYLGNSSSEKLINNIESLFIPIAPDIKIHPKDKPPDVPSPSVQRDTKPAPVFRYDRRDKNNLRQVKRSICRN